MVKSGKQVTFCSTCLGNVESGMTFVAPSSTPAARRNYNTTVRGQGYYAMFSLPQLATTDDLLGRRSRR